MTDLGTQNEALRALLRGWLMAVRGADRDLFDDLCQGILEGTALPREELALPGLSNTATALFRDILKSLGEL